jgi:hypothetical protein
MQNHGTTYDGFDPAKAFGGAKPGWIFKTGGHGLGYYREAAAGKPQQPQFTAQQYGQYGGGGGQYDAIDGFHPAKAFGGAKPGWIFKTGGHGLGYYREAAAGQPQQPQVAQPATLEVRPICV